MDATIQSYPLDAFYHNLEISTLEAQHLGKAGKIRADRDLQT